MHANTPQPGGGATAEVGRPAYRLPDTSTSATRAITEEQTARGGLAVKVIEC